MLNTTQKKIEGEKYGNKDGKALYKLMINAVYGKTMQKKLRSRLNVRLVSNEKVYLKLNQAICHKKYLILIWWQFGKTKLH